MFKDSQSLVSMHLILNYLLIVENFRFKADSNSCFFNYHSLMHLFKHYFHHYCIFLILWDCGHFDSYPSYHRLISIFHHSPPTLKILIIIITVPLFLILDIPQLYLSYSIIKQSSFSKFPTDFSSLYFTPIIIWFFFLWFITITIV